MLEQYTQHIELPLPQSQGVLTRVVGLTVEASGMFAAIGSYCNILGPNGQCLVAEVVGFSNNRVLLMPFDRVQGVAPGYKVRPSGRADKVGMARQMLGRVLDGMGQPIDGGPAIQAEEYRNLLGAPISPMDRQTIEEPLDIGIRSINAILTMGRGQRVGLMAGSGVGKSVLLGMITRFTQADVIVIGLIGERGREVQEFVQQSLGAQGLQRSVVVAAPSDTAPVTRLHGARLATTIAEFFRDQGYSVLLLMDSISRVAQAQREIGLAVGEPPTAKGYPPSVFSLLPSLMERAGNSSGRGSITAVYTVLAEGDDQQDPIVDAVRSVLDGHFVLSRQLASKGHYPALDISQSVSRLATVLQNQTHQQASQEVRQLLSEYQANEDLVSVGAYQRGTNPLLDQAIDKKQQIDQFLRQAMHEPCGFEKSIKHLQMLAASDATDARP